MARLSLAETYNGSQLVTVIRANSAYTGQIKVYYRAFGSCALRGHFSTADSICVTRRASNTAKGRQM